MFSKFSRFTKLQKMPEGCDAVNDDGACIKQQTPWVSPCSCNHLHVQEFSYFLQEKKARDRCFCCCFCVASHIFALSLSCSVLCYIVCSCPQHHCFGFCLTFPPLLLPALALNFLFQFVSFPMSFLTFQTPFCGAVRFCMFVVSPLPFWSFGCSLILHELSLRLYTLYQIFYLPLSFFEALPLARFSCLPCRLLSARCLVQKHTILCLFFVYLSVWPVLFALLCIFLSMLLFGNSTLCFSFVSAGSSTDSLLQAWVPKNLLQ